MLTRRGRSVLGLAVVLLVAGRILGVTELFGLAVAAAVVAFVGIARVRAPQLRVQLSARAVPQVIAVGETALLELSIDNTGSVPTPGGRLQLVPLGHGPVVEVPRLVPGERATISLRLPSDRRGRHEVAGFDAVIVDALGTARRRLTGTGPSRYGVRPPVETLPGALPTGEAGAGLETTRSSADRLASGASLLRGYLDGDDLRRIHWPTTARVGDLMVREGGDRQLDVRSGITVVLSGHVIGDKGRGVDEEPFEDAVRFAASLVGAAEREGTFRLVVPGSVDSGEGGGSWHLEGALEALTDLQAVELVSGRDLVAPSPPAAALVDQAVLFVAACERPESVAELFGASPFDLGRAASGVVVVCAGCPRSGIEVLGRGRLLVRVSPGGSIAELWSAGEPGMVRT